MTKEESELLNILDGIDSTLTSQENIDSTLKKLKDMAKKFTKINNELVDKLWDIDLKLSSSSLKQASESLQKERDLINQTVIDGDYSKKISQIIAVIRQLEIQTYGASDVGGNSPYRL